MKVLKKGSLAAPWIGQQIICTECTSMFLLERGDQVKRNGHSLEYIWYVFECIVCKNEIPVSIRKVINVY